MLHAHVATLDVHHYATCVCTCTHVRTPCTHDVHMYAYGSFKVIGQKDIDHKAIKHDKNYVYILHEHDQVLSITC